MNIEQLYRDFNVPFVTEGHKHSREGWINVECPFCVGNFGYHLGYDIHGEKFHCYRCGGKPAVNAIASLLRIDKGKANTILRQYGVLAHGVERKETKIRTKAFTLPSNSEEMKAAHKRYLRSRDFDPDKLAKEYGLLGTGMFSVLEKISYKYRIVIPYTWEGSIVSFDSRDITGKSGVKYLACPDAREVVPHKKILYGRQDKWGSTGVAVEGSTDVWRMGFNSFATSGIQYTSAQLRLIAKTFKRVPVLFDPDPQAIIQANKLVADLKFRGVESFRVDIESDPGDLPQEEADYLMKQLI